MGNTKIPIRYLPLRLTKKDKKFTVTKKKTDLAETFYNKTLATVWIIYYKRNLIAESNRIKNLDTELEGNKGNIEVHTRLCTEAKDLEKRSIYFIKLQEDRVKHNNIVRELDHYIVGAKHWQEQRFKQIR